MKEISIIVAVDECGGIAKEGKIPWKLREDMTHFQRETENSTVVIGRITWENISEYGKRNILTFGNRQVVIVSTTMQSNHEYSVARSLTDAIGKSSRPKICVCGGNRLYAEAYTLPFARLVMSLVDGCWGCDTFLSLPQWNLFTLVYSQRYVGFTVKCYSSTSKSSSLVGEEGTGGESLQESTTSISSAADKFT